MKQPTLKRYRVKIEVHITIAAAEDKEQAMEEAEQLVDSALSESYEFGTSMDANSYDIAVALKATRLNPIPKRRRRRSHRG